MADTSRDNGFDDEETKDPGMDEVLLATVYMHHCCDEGEKCLPCNASYLSEELQLLVPECSYRSHLAGEEAEDISNQYVSQIRDDRRYISGRLERHADIVISRWTKNGAYGSQQKRENLLSEAAVDLAKTPEDIIRYIYSQGQGSYFNRSLQNRRMLLLPWLNIELLKTTPDALLALFHCRTTYEPSEWAAFDGEQFQGYWDNGHFECDFSMKTIVMYGERYGTLVAWNAEEIHRGDTVGFPFGRLILEAQSYLMGILRRVLDALLQGIDDSHPVRTEKWHQATATGTFRRTNIDIEPWSSYTRGAFCAPPRFDLAYWVSLAKSRREKTEDHLRALQCDLAYMRRYIRKVADSAQWTKISAQEKCKWFVAKISAAVESCYMWRFIEDECRHVDQICRRHGDNGFIPGRPLPHEVDQALGNFNTWMASQVDHRTHVLFKHLAMSPAFSRHWKSTHSGNCYLTIERTSSNSDCMATFRDDPLDWYLVRMIETSGTGKLLGYARLFALLEDHLSACKVGESRRIDELMFDTIDDLAAVHEMANAILLRRPMSQITSNQAVRRGLGTRVLIGTRMRPEIDHALDRVCKVTGPHLLKVYQQSKPLQGLKGQAWIDQQQELRTSLNAFWASMRELKKSDFDRSDLSAKEAGELLEVISADLCPEHQRAVKDEEDAVCAAMNERRVAPTMRDTRSIFIDEEDEPQTPKLEVVHAKTKKKTRPGTPAAVPPEAPASELSKLSLEDTSPREPIVVPRRTFQEFVCKIFPTGKNEGKKGVDWQMFVRGMTAVGCSVTNSGGGGSEVLFSHETFGKITFHRPHPEPRVDAIKLHAWAQRLQRRFGWSRERFAVAGAQPSEATEGSKNESESKNTSESQVS